MNNNLPITERKDLNAKTIDMMSVSEGLETMLKNQEGAIIAIKKVLPEIKNVVHNIHKKLKLSNDSRIIYVGAGSSGRIAVQDGVELYPTFGWPKNRIKYFIAGGKDALVDSIENAEDDIISAKNIVKKADLNANDILIGLAASGNTPFTLSVMKEAKKYDVMTVGISNNVEGKILNICDYKILLETGMEIITGSTRLKAGTAQKICLNLISSMVMVKMNFVKYGEMINLVATNKKLKERKLRIKNILKYGY